MKINWDDLFINCTGYAVGFPIGLLAMSFALHVLTIRAIVIAISGSIGFFGIQLYRFRRQVFEL